MLKKISNIGDCGITCDFGDEVNKNTNKEVIKLFNFIQDSVNKSKIKGILNYTPSYNKLIINFELGQIKSNEKSAQLDMNFEDKPVKGLKALLEGFTHSYLSFLGCADAKSDCVSMWTVHSYEGDYNPLHDHGVNTPTGMSCILYLKVPPQIEKLSGSAKEYETGGLKLDLNNASGTTDGFTFFSWGMNCTSDIKQLKPVQEAFVKPEVGKLLMFPNWLKHSVSPFYGEGERRTLSANFEIELKTMPLLADQKILAQSPQ